MGLIFIIKGGDYFVDAATWTARVTGIPEFIIGATIVSLATTLPEATVSILSAIQNQPSMAVGNAIGSTICNTGLILGIYNIVKPSNVNSRVFVSKGILLIISLLTFWYLSKSFIINFQASIILLGLLCIYFIFSLVIAGYKKKKNRSVKSKTVSKKEWLPNIAKFIFGAILILLGADLLVKHGVSIAQMWGIPSAVISLTLIALGTSLPELVTSITALIKGHAGLSIGNILGANILNITMVIGLSSQFMPLHISEQMYFIDIPVSILLNLFLVIPSIFSKRISRGQSILLLLIYFSYITMLFIHYNF